MDFVDSFTQLQVIPPDPLVKKFYKALNEFVQNKNHDFLDLWHEGEECVLYFNQDERERGGDAIRRCLGEVQRVLAKAPSNVLVKPIQILFQKQGEMAFAVVMEQTEAQVPAHLVVEENRATIIWRYLNRKWKVVHYHSNVYSRRNEAFSEMLRRYERKP